MNYCPSCSNTLKTQALEQREKQVCSSDTCDFVNWNNPTPVVTALVQLGKDYILARNAQWSEGIFSVIAGYLEEGELPEYAIQRELNEELGLQSAKVTFIGHFMLAAKNQLIIAFHIEALGNLKTNHEILEVKTLSSTELQQYDFGDFVLTKDTVNAWFQKLQSTNTD